MLISLLTRVAQVTKTVPVSAVTGATTRFVYLPIATSQNRPLTTLQYAGFGPLPTTNTGEAIVDALVWVKPGGEADGTSDPTAPRYDTTCGNEYALQPAPEAGTWFQAYFEQLLRNANPKIPRLI